MKSLLAVLALAMLGASPDDKLAPWGANTHPSDVAKSHIEDLSAGRHAYSVKQSGTMDGLNCRTPYSVGMMDGVGIEQVWESNRSVKLENVGETDLVNPWLSNGRNNFRTMEEIVASAISPGMSDREKAFAIWYQQIRNRYHRPAGGSNAVGSESGDAVKTLNVYGHDTCGDDSMCLAGLWKKAGLKVAPCRLVGHCVSQVFYENRWNVLDGDMHSMFLMRDNQTLAGEQDIVRDHDLVKRSHTQGILNPDVRSNDEWEASIYVFEGAPKGDRGCYVSNMNMTLRPGEAITWRWGHVNKWRGQRPMNYSETICNGLWEYRPDFSKELWRKGAESIEAVKSDGGTLVAEAGKSGTIVWSVSSPYVYLGGKLEAEGTGAKFSVSLDGKTWQDADADLDKFFKPEALALYQYRLRCRLEGDAKLRRLRIVNDVQMAPGSLPGMAIGQNEFVYTDQSPGPRKARITHEWVERSASRPPEAPSAAIFPADKGETKGTSFTFKWAPSKDPDGDKVTDYHFELSNRADMKWPLSMNFYRLISRTADKGKAQFTMPQAGLLNPDGVYYWHVKAKDEKGVWGPWSKTWSFTPRGPGLPVDLTLAVDDKSGLGVLRWKSGSAGRKPAKYRVYGSDEKGFSVSDEPYKVNVGISKELPATFQPNFLAEVTTSELAVLGSTVTGSNANRAFYRVVAVDEDGNRSGPSDYAAAPRPFLYYKLEPRAKVGSEYRATVASVRSIGDLRARITPQGEQRNFWDIESPRYSLLQGPAWLRIDEKTGVLVGIPDAPGRVTVVLGAVIEQPERKLDEQTLSWGNEKVVSSGVQTIGSTKQEVMIQVDP